VTHLKVFDTEEGLIK